jgi:rhodanese-related sulfurtransferase
MRLKQLFSPVKNMDPDEARRFIETNDDGKFTILDVRQPAEYQESHIPGAELIPLPELHNSIDQLNPEIPVIVQCAVGGRSRAAAQLLSGYGFKEVYNLKGGIKAWQGLKATGPKELNLDLVRGDETAAEIAALAYDMEDCLQLFYKEMQDRAQDQEVRELFTKLASIEEKHKRTILELSARMELSGTGRDTTATDRGQLILEGGFDMAEFMEQNEPNMKTVPDVIELAMMLETQALDLYLRFAHKSINAETKEVLFRIAQEEKSHLAELGTLLEEKI